MIGTIQSLPALQKRLFEIMRALEDNPATNLAHMVSDLPAPQQAAVIDRDIVALGAFGVHPCLLIGFAHAVGVYRPAFMDRLPEFKLSPEVPRWRK